MAAGLGVWLTGLFEGRAFDVQVGVQVDDGGGDPRAAAGVSRDAGDGRRGADRVDEADDGAARGVGNGRGCVRLVGSAVMDAEAC